MMLLVDKWKQVTETCEQALSLDISPRSQDSGIGPATQQTSCAHQNLSQDNGGVNGGPTRTLVVEYWGRTDECLGRKWAHMEIVDELFESREELILATTLSNMETVLEPNMFPYDTPEGIEHWTLWSRHEMEQAEIEKFVWRWLRENAPQVESWNYDENLSRSINIFHVHVYLKGVVQQRPNMMPFLCVEHDNSDGFHGDQFLRAALLEGCTQRLHTHNQCSPTTTTVVSFMLRDPKLDHRFNMAEHLLGDDAACTAALRGLLSLLPGDDSAAQREASSLSLVANFRHVAPSAILQTLQSLMAVESYSHSLQRYPLVKQAFWEQVLASDLMVGASTTRRQQLQLRDEGFPRLVLDFSRCKLTAELLESLRQFLADSEVQAITLQSQFSGVKVERGIRTSVRVVPVAVKLIRCRLTADLIGRLKTLLMPEWWEFEEGKRNDMSVRYCITSLDLSENAMKTEELIALAELLNECGRRRQRRWEMPLEELVLENALGLTLTTEKWAAFRAFVGAAFGIAGGGRTSLKRLSLANNSLSYHHVGCICSALRYEGTALEELSLAHTFSLVDPVDRKTCWQWLAIGLRPMIPHNRRSGLRRLDLSGNPLFPMDSDAWLESLRDPQATLIQWLDDVVPQVRPHRDAATVRCLLSSSTELYSSPSEASSRLHIIEKEVKAASLGAESKEWEVLASLDGEPRWLCVAIPGFGVVWTQGKHAMSWEHTENGVAPASAVLSELVMNDMAVSLTTTEALESFLGGFGGRLQSLELRRNALSAMDLDAILAGCPQLHTLDVEGCRILQLQLLVDALSGDLGRHLRTLNLNANLVGADSMNVLAAALRGQVQGRVLVLQELRAAHNEIGANGVRHLHAALETNKMLMLLELDLPNESADAPRRPDDDEYIQLYRTRCMRLDVSFQNELLGVTPLPVDRKFAFLLVLNANDLVLDRGICSVIFNFAADEKRRRILWNSSHR